MMIYHPTTPHIKQLLNTKKREFGLQFISFPHSHNTASYWEGGSINYYSVMDLQTGKYSHPPAGSYPDFKAAYILPKDHILIQSGVFCGKPATIKIYAYEDNKQNVMDWFKL